MGIRLRLTKKQLAEVVECYASAFRGWEIVERDRIVRAHGPIIQQIGFEALTSGSYRPSTTIVALPLPSVGMLHQFLDVKHREADHREHPRMWKSIVTAMEEQFRPSIRKPLDLEEVKRLCEQKAKESTNDVCMLAILNAYLGNSQEAIFCCERMQDLPPPTLAPRLDWEELHKEFGRRLKLALYAGNERKFLDSAAADVSRDSA